MAGAGGHGGARVGRPATRVVAEPAEVDHTVRNTFPMRPRNTDAGTVAMRVPPLSARSVARAALILQYHLGCTRKAHSKRDETAGYAFFMRPRNADAGTVAVWVRRSLCPTATQHHETRSAAQRIRFTAQTFAAAP